MSHLLRHWSPQSTSDNGKNSHVIYSLCLSALLGFTDLLPQTVVGRDVAVLNAFDKSYPEHFPELKDLYEDMCKDPSWGTGVP